MNAYFEKKLQEISEDDMQFAAYKAVNNTVVIAGPGSGKTTVLTLKVMQLLAEMIYPPRGLACLTYSTEAVREFKSRLVKLGLEKRKNVFLGTVHSFCLSEIITPFAALYPQYKIPLPIRIISEAEKNRLFNSQNYEGTPKLIDVDKERTRNIKGISRVAIESYDIALKAAISFEELLIQNEYLDFISMVKKSVELIKNESYVRKALEAKYPWIIVDEYQDLGKPLHELILTLLNLTRIKVFAVGDADQSIYDFQGAAPDYLIELSQRQDVSCIHLKNNYRSSQTIVDASEYVLKSSRGYIASGKLQDYHAKLEFIECSKGMDEQYERVIEQISRFHTEGIPYHEIAVLVGNNKQVTELAQECSRQNIPAYIARQTFRLTDLIIWIQNCAKWVSDKCSVSFDEICSTWKSFISQKRIISEDDYFLLKRTIFQTLTASKVYKDNLSEWLCYLDKKVGIVSAFTASERYPDEIDNYNKLLETARSHDTQLTIKFLTRLGIPENQVVLTTRHSSKGLEFDVVILPGMEKDSFPSYYDNTPRKLAEARRLCFVSVSRARKACILIRSKNLQNQYGRWFSKEPSPFWVALQEFQDSRSDY
ncbi:ATP-dependent helicase [Oscillibacter acetigenes]|uniref:DNA 3'-5' helicase n=1 Tax=Dysosmobacter welbionis TaxID=2093857 RepID=A0A4D7AST8_9FIRM|nr:ATP-dependent helicase [Oscillibacter acetigenes]MCU6750819.1 ATP-dependent helicase [Oscillibacter acetigenes]QCI60925.1 ATP-dependent helicase [Dysosmobacter welbionis]